jgi:LacI family transcriptional regulator
MVHLLAGRGGQPTAVFAHNDPMAIGALDVIGRSGLRCPEDVSILGCNDDAFVAHINPSLSTIRIHAYDIGRRAGDLVARILADGDVVPAEVVVPPLLVPRASTARRS